MVFTKSPPVGLGRTKTRDRRLLVEHVVMQFLCRIGLHKWIMIRHESEVYLRCLARNEVRGKYCGIVTGIGDEVTDRECLCCGKRDFRIEEVKRRVVEEERFIWERIKSA